MKKQDALGRLEGDLTDALDAVNVLKEKSVSFVFDLLLAAVLTRMDHTFFFVLNHGVYMRMVRLASRCGADANGYSFFSY